MELLKFTVRNQHLSVGKTRLVSDSIDYVEAGFDFKTDEWEGLSKWAHFIKGDTIYDINLVEDKITRDMHLNLEAGEWEVKLHGTDSNGTMRVTTGTAVLFVDSYGTLEEGAPLPEVSLSAAEQIDAKSQKALENSEKAVSIAEETENNMGETVAEAVKEYLEENPPEGGSVDLTKYEERLLAAENAIADLLYEPISILSFTHDAGTRENGDEVWNLMLSYSLNKAAEDLILDGESRGSTEGNTTGWIISQSGGAQGEPIATATRTYTLEAVDERGATAKKTTTINFYDGVYYGCAEEPAAVNSEFILSLTKKLSGGKNLTVNVTGGDNKYFWYAYPKSMGASIFNIGGFDYEYEAQTVLFTNAFGVTKDYLVYRSGQAIPGNVSVTVKGG